MNIDINTNKTFLDPTYRACRAAGMTAREALERSHYVRQIRADFDKWGLEDSKHWEQDHEVWSLSTPEGRYEVSYDVDQDASLDDADCYDQETREAWGSGWCFYDVTAVFIANDGRVGYGSISSVDAGSHFQTPVYPLDETDQIFAVAIDYYKIHEQARDEALAQPAVVPDSDPEMASYDPMNALGAAGYIWQFDLDECAMVFMKDGAHMTGDPLPGGAGVNLCLQNSFTNETLTADYATADEFVAAFTRTFDRLFAEWNEE